MPGSDNHLLRSPNNSAGFRNDPLQWLRSACTQSRVVSVDPDGPALTRDPDAHACIAVFGSENVRTVLSDVATFGMPMSIAARLGLPAVLANLNTALFSMDGSQHRHRQRLLAGILGPAHEIARRREIDAALSEELARVASASELQLIHWTRRVAGVVAERVILGAHGKHVAPVVQRYFDLRRAYATRDDRAGPAYETLVDAGNRVDQLLRERVRIIRGSGDDDSVIGELSQLGDQLAEPLCEDELIAHANILMMSSSEPIATALTWTLLSLSQRPRLRADLRELVTRGGPEPGLLGNPRLLVATVKEVLRLVPPNAIMARITRTDVLLDTQPVPRGTEVAISPFVEHRSPRPFVDPDRFRPERWATVQPNPFQYLPFGSGGRACLGRGIAIETICAFVTALLGSYDVVLADDQYIDWWMNVTLMPSTDPVMSLRQFGDQQVPVGGRLLGPARTLIGVDPE
jgi:cytochrome P450